MEILALLFVAWLVLGALCRAVRVLSSATITVHVTEIRRGGDDRPPEPEAPIVPRPEPEVLEAAERRKVKE